MLKEPTLEKLHAMRLGAMAAAWQEQQATPDTTRLSFDERLGMIVEAEYLARENRRQTRLLRDAKLRFPEACVEDVEASPARGLERPLLRQLGSGEWVRKRLNVILMGKTGVGKSYVGCALAQTACRQGARALYRRVPRLFDELKLARADGTYARLLARFAKIDVLVLDDLGLGTPTEDQRHDLLEIFEDRYGMRSTIITAQMPPAKWHQWLNDPTLADGILDRVVHNAYKIHLKGESRRKTESTENN